MSKTKLVIEVSRIYTFELEVSEEFAQKALARQAELKAEDHTERAILTDQIWGENPQGWQRGLDHPEHQQDLVTCITRS